MKLRLLLFSAALAATPALMRAQVGVGVDIRLGAPPPDRVERIPPAPAPGWIWVRGHWFRHRRHWVWIHGFYQAPRPGMVWVAGHWSSTPNGYLWIEGAWTPAAAYAPPAPAYAPGPAAAVITAAPPAPYVEHPGPPPGPHFFWISGHWAWRGRWVWVRGHYARHPHFHPGARWVDGYWVHRGGGYVWIGGRWE